MTSLRLFYLCRVRTCWLWIVRVVWPRWFEFAFGQILTIRIHDYLHVINGRDICRSYTRWSYRKWRRLDA